MVQKTPNLKVSPHQHQQKIITLCSEEEFLEIPQGQFLNGVNNGLYLTLDSEAFESSYDDEFSLSTGFLITLSYPFTRPIVKQKGPKLFTELSFPKFCSSLIVSYILLTQNTKTELIFLHQLGWCINHIRILRGFPFSWIGISVSLQVWSFILTMNLDYLKMQEPDNECDD